MVGDISFADRWTVEGRRIRVIRVECLENAGAPPQPVARGSLLEPKRWAASATGVPNRHNNHFVVDRYVVDVITTSRQKDPSRAFDGRSSIRPSDIRRRADERERGFQFFEKQARRSGSMFAPPLIDRSDVMVGFWSGTNVRVHPLRRSSSMIAEAGRSSPACADAHDLASVSCRA